MKTFLIITLLMSFSLSMPWCHTQNCNISYDYRAELNFSSINETVRIKAPKAESFLLLSYDNFEQEEIPFNKTGGDVFFKPQKEAKYYLYFSNSSFERQKYNVPLVIKSKNYSHPELGAELAIDKQVGDTTTFQMFEKEWYNPPSYFYKDTEGHTLTKIKLKMILATPNRETYYGVCGYNLRFCTSGNCYTPRAVSIELCKGCIYNIDPMQCVSEGKITAMGDAANLMKLYIYDVAVAYDYVESNETASMQHEEKAPNITINIGEYQEKGKVNFSVENSGYEASFLEVKHSDLNLSEGIHDIHFNILYNGISKYEYKTVVVYSKTDSFKVLQLNESSVYEASNYSFFSDRDYPIIIPECGIDFNITENSSETKQCAEKHPAELEDKGFSVTSALSSSGNYEVANTIITPEADYAETGSDLPYTFSGTELKIFRIVPVTVSYLELGEFSGTKYPDNLMVSVSSDFNSEPFEAVLAVQKGSWSGYSTYSLEEGTPRLLSSEETGGKILIRLSSLNEKVVVSFKPQEEETEEGNVEATVFEENSFEENVEDEDLIYFEETDSSSSEESLFSVESKVFLNGSKATVSVFSDGAYECILILDGGEAESIRLINYSSEKSFINLPPGEHKILVKCFFGNETAESVSEFLVEEVEGLKITAMSVSGNKRLSPVLAGILVFFTIIIFSAIIMLFIKKRKTANRNNLNV